MIKWIRTGEALHGVQAPAPAFQSAARVGKSEALRRRAELIRERLAEDALLYGEGVGRPLGLSTAPDPPEPYRADFTVRDRRPRTHPENPGRQKQKRRKRK